jgi:hypothetical protein
VVVVLRSGRLRVVIYLNDHPPAHVHVVGDGEAKIDIAKPAGGVTLIWARGMTRAEIREAVALVAANRDALLGKWEAIHGGADG